MNHNSQRAAGPRHRMAVLNGRETVYAEAFVLAVVLLLIIDRAEFGNEVQRGTARAMLGVLINGAEADPLDVVALAAMKDDREVMQRITLADEPGGLCWADLNAKFGAEQFGEIGKAVHGGEAGAVSGPVNAEAR